MIRRFFDCIAVFRRIRTGGGRLALRRTKGEEPFLTRVGKTGGRCPHCVAGSSRRKQTGPEQLGAAAIALLGSQLRLLPSAPSPRSESGGAPAAAASGPRDLGQAPLRPGTRTGRPGPGTEGLARSGSALGAARAVDPRGAPTAEVRPLTRRVPGACCSAGRFGLTQDMRRVRRLKGSLSPTLSLQARSPRPRGAALCLARRGLGLWARGDRSTSRFAAAAIASPAEAGRGVLECYLGVCLLWGLFLCAGEGTITALPRLKGDWCAMEAAGGPPPPSPGWRE